MNDAGDRVNSIQNEIITTEKEIQSFKAATEKRKLDLKLKYRKRIDYANIYYEAKNNLQKMSTEAQEAKENYHLACRNLAECRENLLNDLSSGANKKLRNLRDTVTDTQNKLSEHDKKKSDQLTQLNSLYKKYKKSIEMTKEYFEAKIQANIEDQRLKEKQKNLQLELSNWRTIYAEHMAKLQEISERIHLERSAKSMADQRLLTSESEYILHSTADSVDIETSNEELWVDTIPDDVSEPDDDSRSICSLTDSHSNNNGNLLRPFSYLDSRSCGSPVKCAGDRISLRSNSPYRRSVSDQSPKPVQKGCITAHETSVSWHPLG